MLLVRDDLRFLDSVMLEVLVGIVLDALVGGLPESQPWRGLIAAVYVVAGVAAVSALIWVVTDAV